MARFLRTFDYFAFFLALALSAIGILAIASATYASRRQELAARQLAWLGISIVALFVTLVIDYRKIAAFAGLLYTAMAGVLFAILAYGQMRKGAQSWFAIGSVTIQPSELAKVTLALLLAKYVISRSGRFLTFFELCVIGIITAIPMALVLLQPDMGTAMTLTPIAFAAAFLGGIRIRYYVIIIVVVAIALPAVYFFGLKPYQKERILTFIDPGRDPQDAGWQVRQSLIAVGSGGMTGKGYRNGSQTRLQFVPEQHTDFIFTVWAEEMGFLGTGIAIGLYLMLVTRILGTAAVSRDLLGAVICGCFAASLAFQGLGNLCMVINLLPTTGIPLPLMSYGGTSLVATYVFLGLSMNVRMRRLEAY
ncbi:MAG: rod shape-determining protein RodA [Acidobacteriota bacterium]